MFGRSGKNEVLLELMLLDATFSLPRDLYAVKAAYGAGVCVCGGGGGRFVVTAMVAFCVCVWWGGGALRYDCKGSLWCVWGCVGVGGGASL